MRRVQLNVSKLDELNRNLLTKLTLQQIKSNDSEKRFMKVSIHIITFHFVELFPQKIIQKS